LKRTPITFLLNHYKESKGHYNDITKIKETVGGKNGVKDSNESASPSPFFFAKEFVV
jgi:hypothetical protein